MATSAAFCNAGADVSSSLPERLFHASEDVAFSSSREPSGSSRILSGGKKADSRFWQIPMIREPWSGPGLAAICSMLVAAGGRRARSKGESDGRQDRQRIQVRVSIRGYRFGLLPKCPTPRPSIATVGILFVLSI
jgi:hypothetical protein